MSQRPLGLPSTIEELRSRSSFSKAGSRKLTNATFIPGFTPRRSRSGFVISATHRSKNNNADEPPSVRACGSEDDQRQQVGNATREQDTERDEHSENPRTHQSTRHRCDKGGSRNPVLQTSTTCRSLTAPLSVPEKR